MDNLKSHRTQRDPHGNPYISEIVKFGGAGALVPITGFANSVVSRQSNIRRRAMSSGSAARSLRSPDRDPLWIFASWVLGMVKFFWRF